MGYTTEFYGTLEIRPALSEAKIEELNKFFDERHDSGDFPSIWADLIAVPATEDFTALEWNGSEKTYELDKWVQYVIDNMLPWGSRVTGTLHAEGEDTGDLWRLNVVNNRVEVQRPKLVWE